MSSIWDGVKIARPCPVRWEEMAGDDFARFCGQCNKHVYNVSSMTMQEAEKLMNRTEMNQCVRLFRRADGTIITQDCPSRFSLLLRSSRLFEVWGLLMVATRGTTDAQPQLGEILTEWTGGFATEDIEENQTIHQGQIQCKKTSVWSLVRDGFSSTEEVIGRKTRKRVAMGQLLCPHSIE